MKKYYVLKSLKWFKENAQWDDSIDVFVPKDFGGPNSDDKRVHITPEEIEMLSGLAIHEDDVEDLLLSEPKFLKWGLFSFNEDEKDNYPEYFI